MIINNQSIQTPCFLIDKSHIDRNINELRVGFKEEWGSNVFFGYSVKTNSLPWLVSYIGNNGFLAEVVSDQEYRLARRLGFGSSEIVLNGPIKGEEVLIEALESGAIVNIDNSEEIRIIEGNLDHRHREWKVGVRFNFQLEAECPGETIVGDRCGRFGFCVENGEFERAIERLSKLNGVSVIGLHGHSSTRSKSIRVFQSISRKASELVTRYGIALEYFDVGGGFYGDKPGEASYREYAKAISDSFGEHEGIRLIVEPGAGIVASPISYLCEVKNTRDVCGNRFVTVDGSCVHIDPQMHGIVFGKNVYRADKNDVESCGRVDLQEVCGFTCIEMDRMGVIRDEVELKPGDRIEYLNCGSYSMTLAPLFISYFPRVYVKDDSKYQLVRDAWDEGDFMSKCEVFI